MAMSSREKYLAIAVAGVIGLLGIQYVISSIRGGLDVKQQRLDTLTSKIEEYDRTLTDIAIATKRLNELKTKSLPNSEELAKNQYSAWLLDLAKQTGMQNVGLDRPQTSGMRSDAFTIYGFVLNGDMRIDDFLKLMHGYYDRDYLQRVRSLKVERHRDDPDVVKVKLDTEAIALKNAPAKQEPSLLSSGRLKKTVEQYQAEILARHPFAPPNRPPQISVAASHDVPRGREWTLELKAVDPDAKHKVKYHLLSEKPDDLNFNEESGKISWTPKADGSHELMVEAEDSGFPPKKSQQKLVLKVVDPPVPPPTVETPKFDVASQSFVSAILSGRDGAQVWIRTKTDNNLVKVGAGDDVSIGTVKAKVVEVNVDEQFVELETEGRHWTLGMDDASLQAAYSKSKEN